MVCKFKYANIILGFWVRVFFYSNEHLPIHIHIRNADGEAKYNVDTMKWIKNEGLKSKDLNLSESLIKENKDLIVRKWQNYFN